MAGYSAAVILDKDAHVVSILWRVNQDLNGPLSVERFSCVDQQIEKGLTDQRCIAGHQRVARRGELNVVIAGPQVLDVTDHGLQKLDEVDLIDRRHHRPGKIQEVGDHIG